MEYSFRCSHFSMMTPIDFPFLLFGRVQSFPFFIRTVLYTTVPYCAVQESILKSWFSLKKVATVIKWP